jgi:outer membrane protein TolC
VKRNLDWNWHGLNCKKTTLTLQTELLKKQTFPKVTAFGTAGYGKPGLNMLSNSFDDYYIVGLKAQWNVFDFQANKKQREALLLQKELIDNQRQVFEWNVNQTAENYKLEVVKYQTLLQTDVEIIQYRKKIVETADKQLKHDLITTSDYTAEVNKLLEAEINQKTHEILMALAQANYNTTLYE